MAKVGLITQCTKSFLHRKPTGGKGRKMHQHTTEKDIWNRLQENSKTN